MHPWMLQNAAEESWQRMSRSAFGGGSLRRGMFSLRLCLRSVRTGSTPVRTLSWWPRRALRRPERRAFGECRLPMWLPDLGPTSPPTRPPQKKRRPGCGPPKFAPVVMGSGRAMSPARATLQPCHHLVQPPAHPALPELDASRKRIGAHVLRVALEPADMLARVGHHGPAHFPVYALLHRNNSREGAVATARLSPSRPNVTYRGRPATP